MKFNKLTEKEKATIGVYRNSKISCYLCNKLQACGKKKASFGTDRSRLINGHIDDKDFCQRAEAFVVATTPIADRIKQCFEPTDFACVTKIQNILLLSIFQFQTI